jgi:Leucine-rich repeat (LRR) protein
LKSGTADLKVISKEDLAGLEKLEELYLINNELTSLPKDLFDDMKMLKSVSFKLNELEKIDL